VEKIRVGQNRKTGVAQNDGRRSDKKIEPLPKSASCSADVESECVFAIKSLLENFNLLKINALIPKKLTHFFAAVCMNTYKAEKVKVKKSLIKQ